MSEIKQTIFQRLNDIFTPEGVRLPKNNTNKYKVGDNELLRTNSKEEFEVAKKQAMQGNFLANQWAKVDNEMYQQSIHYESTRVGAYTDYEAMEFYPEIAAALDIMMEESTTPNDQGKVLNIYSNSDRVKGVLDDLFFNRLDLHTVLPMWVRNTCKYGNNFIYHKIDGNAGIVGAKQMPNFEMERRETDLIKSLNKDVDDEDENKVKFLWRGRDIEFNSWQITHFRLLGDDRKLPYGSSVLDKARRIWKQCVLSEDAMLVYRVTRAPERRVYKVYVGNIDDADVPAYVQQIANKFKRTPVIDPQTGQIDLKYNQMSYDQDFFIPVRTENAPNPIDTLPGACIALDTRIPLLDGRTLELNEIIKEWNNGNKDLWVYSCDPITGKLAPGIITWAGETRKNTEVIKITLDNGESITTTPDHKWVHRTNGFVEAKDLNIGDSLMPFYRDKELILQKKKYGKEYERIWDSEKQEWVFTHRMVNEFMKKEKNENYFTFEGDYSCDIMKTIHHMNNNRFNNNPNNLFLMDSRDHYKYHRYELWSTPEKKEKNIEKITKGINNYISNLTEEERKIRGEQSKLNSINSRNKANETFENNPNKDEIIKNRGKAISEAKSSEEFKNKFSEICKEKWKSEDYKNKVFSKKQTITFTDELYNMFFEMFKLFGKSGLTLIELNKSNDFINEFSTSNSEIRSSMTNLTQFTHNHLIKMLKGRGYKNYQDWSKQMAIELDYKNIKDLQYYIDKNIHDTKSNYNHKIINIEWLNNKIDTGTITVDGDEKYHNYHTFATESGVFIKNSNLDQISDILHLQGKLFTALRVPKSFLGFDEATGDGKNLALQDIRFSRTINRIQQAIIMGLNQMAIIHLYLLGFEDDLDNFTLTLNNPSTQAEMLKVEHLQSKISLYAEAVRDAGNGFGAMSMTRAKREILGFSNDDIKADLLEQRIEKAAAAELEATSSVIKKTGFFDKVDNIYGIPEDEREDPKQDESGDSSGGEAGGFAGGGDFGSDEMDFGDEAQDPEGFGGDENSDTNTDEFGGDAEDFGGKEESFIRNTKNMLTEEKKLIKNKIDDRKTKYTNIYMDNLLNNVNVDKNITMRSKMNDKTLKINENINDMINDIEKTLND